MNDILLQALKFGLPILRHAQIYGLAEGAEVKSDDSLLTWVDRKIEEVMREYLANYGEVYGEEFGRFGNPDERYLFVIDPVDGTRTIVNHDMGGASIIVYVYDKHEKRIITSAIGRPGTGEVWLAHDGKTLRYQWGGSDSQFADFKYVKDCKVWTPAPGVQKATVYVDCRTDFSRRGVPMLGNDGLDVLESSIRRAGYSQFGLGSNGTHHGVLANGGEVAGTLTVAIGGIQDLGGILLVENAGGVVRTFRMDGNRWLHDCHPHEDLLIPGGYDFLVMAVDECHLETLVGILRKAVSA